MNFRDIFDQGATKFKEDFNSATSSLWGVDPFRKTPYRESFSDRSGLSRARNYVGDVLGNRRAHDSFQVEKSDHMWEKFRRIGQFGVAGHRAAQAGLAESLSDPLYVEQLKRHGINYNDFIPSMTTADSKGLLSTVEKLMQTTRGKVDGFSERLQTSIGDRAWRQQQRGERAKQAGRSLDRINGSRLTEMTFDNPNFRFSRKAHLISEADLPKGISGLEEAKRSHQIARQGVAQVAGGLQFMKIPSGNGTFNYSARLNTRNAGSISMPLGTSQFDFGGGVVEDVYHSGDLGQTLNAPPRTFTTIGTDKGELAVGKQVGWMDHIFRAEDSVLNRVLRDGGVTNLESAMTGLDPDGPALQGALRYMQHIEPTMEGGTIALGRSTTTMTPGFNETAEALRMTTAQLNSAIEKEILSQGEYIPRMSVSPGQATGVAGKDGSFDLMRQGEQGVLNLYKNPDLVSDRRRGKQPLNAPYSMTNQRQVSEKLTRIRRGAIVFNPLNSPSIDTPLRQAMAQGGVAPLVRPAIFIAEQDAKRFQLSEGVGKSLEGSGFEMVEYNSARSTSRIAAPSETAKMIKVDDRLQVALDIGRRFRDPEERMRQIAFHYGPDSDMDFKNGEILGQRWGEGQGLIEERLQTSGTGNPILLDVEASERGWKLKWASRSTNVEGRKGFGSGKITESLVDVDSFLQGFDNHRLADNFNLVVGNKELIKPSNDLHRRGQQMTGLRDQLFGEHVDPVRGDRASDDILHKLTAPGKAWDIQRGLGVDTAQKLWPELVGSDRASGELLAGILHTAKQAVSEQQGHFGAGDLGAIFNLEKHADSAINLMETAKTPAFAGIFGESFAKTLQRGIEESHFAVGDAVIFARDDRSAWTKSAPNVERRGLEYLLDGRGFPQVNGVNLADILLEDIKGNIEGPSRETMSTIAEFQDRATKAAQNPFVVKQGNLESVSEAMKKMRQGGGGYLDLRALGGSVDELYIPSKVTTDKLGGMITLGGGMEPFEVSHGRSIDQLGVTLESAVSPKATADALNLANSHVESVKKQQLMVAPKEAEKLWRSSLKHSIYQQVGEQDLRRTLKNMGNGVEATRAGGLGIAMNREAMQDLRTRALENASSADERRLIQQHYKDAMGSKRKLMAVNGSRNPNLIQNSRQMLGAYYEPKLDAYLGRVTQYGSRFENGKDYSPGLAVSTAFDRDGDRMQLSMITGKHAAIANEAINDDSMLESIHDWNRATINRRDALTTMFRNQFAGHQAGSVSKFVEAGGSLVGQAEIGPLSSVLDQFQQAVRYGQSVGEHSLSDEAYTSLIAAREVIEQEAVSFKAVEGGLSPARQMTEAFQYLMNHQGGEEATDSILRSTFETVFGGQVRQAGFFGQSWDEISLALTPGIEALKTPEGQAMLKAATTKTESMAKRSLEQINEVYAVKSVGMGGLEASEMLGSMIHGGDELQSATGGMDDAAARIKAGAENMKRKARANRAGLGRWALGGLLATGAIYAAFDKGYSDTALSVPGEDVASLGMQQAIADGSILSNNFRGQRPSGAGPEFAENQSPNGRVLSAPNAIPSRAALGIDTGRMSVDGPIGQYEDPEVIANRLRASMPYANIGVNVNHSYRVPRNLEDQI